MMEELQQPVESSAQTQEHHKEEKSGIVIALVVFLVVVIATIVVGIILALHPEQNGPGLVIFRNTMIILVGLEAFVIGAALVVLLIQLARLVNMLNNEITPMVKTTQETLQILKGTSEFMSKYLADPVIDANAKASLVTRMAKDLGRISGVMKK